MNDKELIELISHNAKIADWRKVQEWFWSLEREKNPTLDILVDGGAICLHHKHSKASPKQSLGRGTNKR
jgi:hypothetical protein